MPLTLESRIGAYDIFGSLGAGGIRGVCPARDAKLNPDVAIKVFPELLARDPERLSRFEREAQTFAALSCSNIEQIFGMIDLPPKGGNIQLTLINFCLNAGSHALAMGFVEGDDVAQRIVHKVRRTSVACLAQVRQQFKTRLDGPA